jgi:hypothetical protein
MNEKCTKSRGHHTRVGTTTMFASEQLLIRRRADFFVGFFEYRETAMGALFILMFFVILLKSYG